MIRKIAAALGGAARYVATHAIFWSLLWAYLHWRNPVTLEVALLITLCLQGIWSFATGLYRAAYEAAKEGGK